MMTHSQKTKIGGLLLAGALLCATSRAEISVFAEVREGRWDTIHGKRNLASPAVGVMSSLGSEGRHAVGLCYSRVAWNTHSAWDLDTGSTGHVGSETQERTHWDTVYLMYQYKQPLAKQVHLYIRGKLGAGKAQSRGTVNQYGGFTGPMEYKINASSKVGLALEADAGLGWELSSHWLLRAGAGYSHVEGERSSGSLGYVDLKGPQVNAGLDYRF